MHTGCPKSPRAEQPEGKERLCVYPGEVAGVPLSIHMDLLFLQIIPLKSLQEALPGWREGPVEAGLEMGTT